MRVGRVDSGAADPEGRLPGEGFSSQQQKDNFSDKGLSPREFLALSGAHTIGECGGTCLGACRGSHKRAMGVWA